jgi:hypothetical protein
MRTVKWLSCLWAAGLAGCSLYPIPDDVTSIPTEDIVRHARCEIRSEVIGYLIENGFIAPSATDRDIAAFHKYVQSIQKKLNNRQKLGDIESHLLGLMLVAAVYSFEFNITEHNNANGGAGFSLPFTGPKVLSGDGSASLDLMRVGSRIFATGDHWGDLIYRSNLCADVRPRPGNFAYPLDGSIGVGRAVRTFIDIANQEGDLGGQGPAKDSFVDTLTFTTTVNASANASIKLAAVPHSFRIVSASAGLSGSRIDMHKMTVSLAFPHPPSPPPVLAITGVKLEPGYLNAPFARPPVWRARYNLCVQDGRQREDAAKQLRFEAPEVYCITFADAFEPKPGLDAAARQAQQLPSTPITNQPPQPAPRFAPPSGRPNRL